MIRAANVVKGMRVLTPSDEVARVDGIVLNTAEDLFPRVKLTYHDASKEGVTLQAKHLRPYLGPPVVFADEVESLRLKHGDKPLSLPPPAPANDA